MRKVIDITGIIQEGMWNDDPPFPKIHIQPLPPVPWADGPVYCEIFEGLHSQTGTYLETPAHYLGNGHLNAYPLIDVPAEKLVDIPCTVLHLGIWDKDPKGDRRGITVSDLEACSNAGYIQEGDAILFSTGWGKYWMDEEFIKASPYITKEAMRWLIDKKPFILGGDSPRWENMQKPEGFFPDFYQANILMLAPCVNLEQVTAPRCKLTALPLKVSRTSCAPCRSVIIEE